MTYLEEYAGTGLLRFGRAGFGFRLSEPRGTGWSGATLGEPATSANKFDSCSVVQKNAIEAAFVLAQRAVNRAAAVLGTLYGGSGKDPITKQRALQLLNTHFHTVDRDDIREILRTVFRLGQAFQKGLAFKCLGYCGNLPGSPSITCGYAQATQWFGGFGSIRLCFDDRPPNACSFLKLSAQEQVALLIHEAAHRHVGIDDKAYIWENSRNSKRDYASLTPKQAMDNADSYAWFCVQL
jgi:hypothetical protein